MTFVSLKPLPVSPVLCEPSSGTIVTLLVPVLWEAFLLETKHCICTKDTSYGGITDLHLPHSELWQAGAAGGGQEGAGELLHLHSCLLLFLTVRRLEVKVDMTINWREAASMMGE